MLAKVLKFTEDNLPQFCLTKRKINFQCVCMHLSHNISRKINRSSCIPQSVLYSLVNAYALRALKIIPVLYSERIRATIARVYVCMCVCIYVRIYMQIKEKLHSTWKVVFDPSPLTIYAHPLM